MRIRRPILLFGLVSATLYSALLPLWEGFDEAFHYAYVETLWQTKQFPVLGRSLVPDDVFRTFPLAPVGPVVHGWVPEATSYDDWFRLPAQEKERRRTELDRLRPDSTFSSRPNYEAHHAPLAYLVLALLDFPMSNSPITVRVLVLRLFAAAASVLLVYLGAVKLCRTFSMPERFIDAVLFTVFCSQMLYATVAHVANDWLAVGISALFIATTAEFVRKPDRSTALVSAAWLAAGLLTKAYFLPLALLYVATAATLIAKRRLALRAMVGPVILLAVLAAPWYARNISIYGNVSGVHEEFEGIGFRQTLAAVPHVDWPATAGFLARGFLWTGNASFTTFSRGTLNAMLGLVLLGGAAWGLRRKSIQSEEQFVLAAVVLFSGAIAFASAAAFVHMNGDSPGAGPWYTQVLLVPVMAMVYIGLSRWQKAGRIAAALMVALWTWVLLATWVIKLLPMYSGAGAAPMRAGDIWRWYTTRGAASTHDLSLLSLCPAWMLYAGLLTIVAMCLFLSAATIRGLVSVRSGGPPAEAGARV